MLISRNLILQGFLKSGSKSRKPEAVAADGSLQRGAVLPFESPQDLLIVRMKPSLHLACFETSHLYSRRKQESVARKIFAREKGREWIFTPGLCRKKQPAR